MTGAEEWRPVPGFPDYMVSDHGRVMSYWHRWKAPRLLRGHPDSRPGGGYQQVYLTSPNGGKHRTVHSLVAEAFHGPRPAGMQVRHLDGNKRNNAASNLRYGTPAENALDAVEHGTHPNGSKVECIRGHAFDEANTYFTPAGTRGCRKCRAWHARELRQRRALRAANIRAA